MYLKGVFNFLLNISTAMNMVVIKNTLLLIIYKFVNHYYPILGHHLCYLI